MQYKCNGEGEDIDPPLPAEWTLDYLKTEAKIKIYGGLMAPSNMRIRFVLKFYEIPFTSVEQAYHKVVDKDYAYKKVPIAKIGDRLVNDGYIILRSLAPILTGRELTETEVAMDRQLTYGLQYPLLAAAVKAGGMNAMMTFNSPNKSPNCCKRCCRSCCSACFLPYVCCACCPCFLPKKVESVFKAGAKKFDVEHTEFRNMKDWEAKGHLLGGALAEREFFAPKDQPGIFDLSLFAILSSHIKVSKNPAAVCMRDASAPLKAWYERMDKIAGHVEMSKDLVFAQN